jgi:hypothetical protein
MPGNTLTGVINITAPGAAAAFQSISNEANKAGQSLTNLTPKIEKNGISSLRASGSILRLSEEFGGILPRTGAMAHSFDSLTYGLERMSAGSGSAISAMQVFKEIFSGPTGIIFAVAAASTIVGEFISKQYTFKSPFEGFSEDMKKVNEAQKELEKNIASAAGEVLNESKNFSDLRSILISTTKANDDLTASIVNQGLARYLFNQKNSELEKELAADVERQLILRKRSTGSFQGNANFVNDPQLDNLKSLQKTMQTFGRGDVGLNNDIKRLGELNNIIGDSKGALSVLDNLGKGFEGLFQTFVDGDKKIVKPVEIKIPKAYLTLEQLYFKLTPSTAQIDAELIPPKELQEQARTGASTFENVFSSELKAYFNKPYITDFKLIDTAKALESAKIASKKIIDSLSSTLKSGIADVASSFGESLGNVFSGAKNPFQSFAQSIGSGLQALGKALIQASIAGELAKKALAFFAANPALGFAAGIALVAAGSAFKNALGGGIKARALGGNFAGGDTLLVGENGPELMRVNTGGSIMPNNQLRGMGAGASGGVMVQVAGAFELRGADLLAAINLANQSKSRLV